MVGARVGTLGRGLIGICSTTNASGFSFREELLHNGMGPQPHPSFRKVWFRLAGENGGQLLRRWFVCELLGLGRGDWSDVRDLGGWIAAMGGPSIVIGPGGRWERPVSAQRDRSYL
jgi:hypothetical protein